ncbi:hypothetical protein QAD02_024139 [Eretmocerus hayati]|uniref:Uncharacterized protein n=1 Tax=Eretmocerus hayati TaxID=131215 RepID=A0ACC2PXJ5_9HYME|nr:hypothetical protein QAD02_024139 [Eretmocerus hayati]
MVSYFRTLPPSFFFNLLPPLILFLQHLMCLTMDHALRVGSINSAIQLLDIDSNVAEVSSLFFTMCNHTCNDYDLEASAGSQKPWDHAWNTEEMRKNRRNWSLAGDSGLLKHLQQFSEDLITKANETRDSIDSMTAELDKTAILVDNITNTSLALANTQFIESRVQEDDVEIDQPVEDTKAKKNACELTATDLLVSVCESIKQGLVIVDEKYERIETAASLTGLDDDVMPRIMLRPKDPYQNRPLPYIIGTEQWTLSSKVGLESSSSDSEQDDEGDNFVGGADNKNFENIMHSNMSVSSGVGRLSTTSSESNDFNIEKSDTKSSISSRSLAQSRDPLDLDKESLTPSNTLKTANISNGPPSFAEELAKRLGNVKPFQNIVAASDADEFPGEHSKENNSRLGGQVDNMSSTRKNNVFPNEVLPTAWKDKPVRPMNNNIIPPSIDVPPPLNNISTAPKSNFDDLFGDGDDSEDSDDIFSNKSSKNIFSVDRGSLKTEMNKQKPVGAQTVQSSHIMPTSTPEKSDRQKSLFSDNEEEEGDLFQPSVPVTKPLESSASGFDKKKPVGGVSIFGKVDILSSSKFARRDSSSSSDASEEHQQQQPQKSKTYNARTLESATRDDNIRSTNTSVASASFSADNKTSNDNLSGNSAAMPNDNSGISTRKPSIGNLVHSSSG